MVEQSADIFCCQVGAQSPGGIDIAKGMGHVGNARVHHAFIGKGVWEVDRCAVEIKGNARHHRQSNPSCGDDNVASDFGAVFHDKALLSPGFNVAGDNLGAAFINRRV